MSVVRRLVLFVFCAACSRESTPPPPDASSPPNRIASCDRVAAMSVCSEYAGSHLAQNELAVTTSCKKLSGTFVYAACPNTSVLGACTMPTSEVRRYYASGANAYAAGAAEKECTTVYGGAWRAP
jgi:hypothetical protein